MQAEKQSTQPINATIINFRRAQTRMKREKKTPPKSWEQLKQRELAWLVYITEGYIANLEHASTVNAVTFTAIEQKIITRIINNAQTEADIIRALMQKI